MTHLDHNVKEWILKKAFFNSSVSSLYIPQIHPLLPDPPTGTINGATTSGQNKSNDGMNHSREVFSSHSSRLYQHWLESSDLSATLARLLLNPFPFLFCPASLCLHPCSPTFSFHTARERCFHCCLFCCPCAKEASPFRAWMEILLKSHPFKSPLEIFAAALELVPALAPWLAPSRLTGTF